MKCLIAEDEPATRRVLEVLLRREGYEVSSAADGDSAWSILQEDDPPRLLLLDWMMPGVDGVEITRRIRAGTDEAYTYIIMLTSRESTGDLVAGLDVGADDYMRKPFNSAELRARLRAGRRVIQLQTALKRKVVELEDAIEQIRQLEGLLPICMFCGKVRDDSDVWQRLEDYVSERLGTRLSHSLCQDCLRIHYGDLDDEDSEPG